jgi:hypothetical protein
MNFVGIGSSPYIFIKGDINLDVAVWITLFSNRAFTAEADKVISVMIFSILSILILRNYYPNCYPVLTKKALLAIESTEYNFRTLVINL